jgi:hypothetical protein
MQHSFASAEGEASRAAKPVQVIVEVGDRVGEVRERGREHPAPTPVRNGRGKEGGGREGNKEKEDELAMCLISLCEFVFGEPSSKNGVRFFHRSADELRFAGAIERGKPSEFYCCGGRAFERPARLCSCSW